MKHRLLILALAGLFCSSSFAQQKLTLTLQEAQAYALEHNRTLKNAALDVQKAEASRWQTNTTLMPQMNATNDNANMMGFKLTMVLIL